MVMAPEIPLPTLFRTGYGNCPPARKLASLPDWVIRFGSARIWRRLCSCKAWIVAPRLMSGRKMKMFSRSLSWKVFCPEVEVVVVEPLVEVVVKLPSDGGENSCVEVAIGIFEPKVRNRFTPYWLIACRLTSANLTCSEISSLGVAGTSRKLVTFGATFLTTSRILSATSVEETLPDNMTTGPDVVTCTGSEGNTS